ncbi:high-affinity iron transporter [Microbulbifer donghaiensis]|uniref:High-affinity iron transporter n=1 Tax=Microbulbifer donghaiensis TaxID=494016 RepID=A0A1M5AYS2_9GAMM|nr:c-type cytochrome [Microbulbifer donghaiensis]SHF35424.1 high-affinity iron transporter [Microbulbifer donghaiensis]
MRRNRSVSRLSLFLSLCLWLSPAVLAQDAPQREPLAAQASNLLSYIAVDYGDSVKSGEIQDNSLYQQQRRYLAQALELVRQLPDKPGRAALENSVLELDVAIAEKRDGEQVRRRANAAADRLAALYQLQRSPAETLPSAAFARPLYRERCAGCHGAGGQGRAGAPDLSDPKRMASFSLYDLYNTLDPLADAVHAARIDGDLSSAQRWALAVTVANFAVAGDEPPPADLAQRYPALIGLPGMATTRPVELPDDAAAALLWSRGHPERVRALEHPLARADGLLELAQTAYRAGDTASAYHKLMLAFREGYLPVREQLAERDAPLAAQLSEYWQGLRTAILGDAPNAEVIAAFQRLRGSLNQARAGLEPPAGTHRYYLWAAFLFAAALALGLLLWFGLRRRKLTRL